MGTPQGVTLSEQLYPSEWRKWILEPRICLEVKTLLSDALAEAGLATGTAMEYDAVETTKIIACATGANAAAVLIEPVPLDKLLDDSVERSWLLEDYVTINQLVGAINKNHPSQLPSMWEGEAQLTFGDNDPTTLVVMDWTDATAAVGLVNAEVPADVLMTLIFVGVSPCHTPLVRVTATHLEVKCGVPVRVLCLVRGPAIVDSDKMTLPAGAEAADAIAALAALKILDTNSGLTSWGTQTT